MASPAAVLSILVEANTKAANASLAKTDAQLRGTAAAATATTGASAKTGTALRKLGTAAKWAGLAVGAAFVIEAKNAVTTTQDLTKSTISLHKNLGLSNKQASEWAGVAKARGVDTTKLGMAFKTLSTQIVAARDGSATSILMFKRLGLSHKDIQKASVDTSFAVKAVADGLNNLKGGADKTAIAGKLFGRGWQTIAPVLRDGSKAMQEQLDLVEKYGGVLEGKTLKQQEELLANIRENKIAWQGFQVELANFVTPALNTVSDQFQRIAAINARKDLTGEEKWAKISRIIDRDFRKALDVIVKAIPEVASRVGQAAPKIAGALVKGFLDANVWGKLFIGAWLIKKMGGWALITALGSRFGTRFGTAASTTAATTMEGGLAKQGGIARAGTAAGMLYGPAFAAALAISLQPVFKKLHDQAASGGGPFKFLSDISIPAEILPHLPEHPGGLLGLLGVGKDDEKKAVPVFDRLKKHYGDLGAAARESSRKQRQAWLDQATAAHLNGDLTLQQLEKLTKTFSNTGERNRKMWRDAAKATGQSVQSIKQSVGDMKVKVSKDYDGMVRVTGHGIDILAKNTNQALSSLGVARSKFMTSAAAHSPLGGTRNFAEGGLAAMVPGQTPGDRHVLSLGGQPVAKVESKEGIFVGNRTLMDTLKAMNAQIPRRAAGGFVGMQPGITKLVKNVISRFGGYLSSGYRPGDVGSFHSKGLAADWVGGDWMGASRYINSIGPSLLEGIHQAPPGRNVSWDSGHKVSPSFWGAATWNEHTSHIHMAIAGAVKAAVDKVARVILKGPPGALTDMGQASLDKVHKAANAYLAKQRPALGNEMLGAGVKTGSIQKMARQMVEKIWGAGQWGPFAALEMSEAGWNPRALNPSSGAAGLAQALPASKYPPGAWPYKGLGSAKLQLEWMMGYIRDRYGTPSKAWAFHQANNYYKQGGVVAPYVGSFDKGGQVASTGLGMLHQGETVVPGMQHGGMTPRQREVHKLSRMIARLMRIEETHLSPRQQHRLHHIERIDREDRSRRQRRFLAHTEELAQTHDKLSKFQRRELARLQRHLLPPHARVQLRHLESQHHLSQAQRERLQTLHQQRAANRQHRDELEKQRRLHHQEVEERRRLERRLHDLEVRRDEEKELISEFKQLRQDMKADRRERHEVRVNESAVFRALRNFMGREIGYQYAQARRNVSPGSAVRY